MIKRFIIRALYAIMRCLPVRKKQVLLFSYYGEQYSGSPKYIGKYLTQNTGLDVIWAFVNVKKHTEFCGKAVRYGHLKYYFYLATAGTIITNYRMTDEFVRREKQKYIQTWHSSLRLKMIERDAKDTLSENYVKMALHDSKQITHLLAGSGKSKQIFERAFWYNGTIIDSGTPQCDILFENRHPFQKKVYQHYQISEQSHIALYAPTFRKNHDTSVYDLNTDRLLCVLKERFGGEWYLLIRLHPHLVGKADCFRYSETVLQATDYDDVQELLCAADVLISDYSAIMFDYSLTRRPCFMYTPDLDEYLKADRDLYFDLKELPFSNYGTQGELFGGIIHFSWEEYHIGLDRFLGSIDSYDDGNASRRVCELIMED